MRNSSAIMDVQSDCSTRCLEHGNFSPAFCFSGRIIRKLMTSPGSRHRSASHHPLVSEPQENPNLASAATTFRPKPITWNQRQNQERDAKNTYYQTNLVPFSDSTRCRWHRPSPPLTPS